ncbi:uroporphyrinogen-III synthase [Luteimonas sp. S4-F44]|uniref:uroporphyrinogen-III synthase n=1 Tax=Luteimonas sp. S4-F44 TaxID=2925842 RepID=UPI001F539C36|nr:uroporphyrinogen-III synthase [Luteimonas sp. S4-F44]UNK42570.1 uroporphyrinogen-III synthase [Luteimonas sp. S4-F44]
MHVAPASSLLAGYYVISLRPVGAHVALRRAAARLGARTFALSPWRIVQRDSDAVRAALQAALDAEIVIFSSPPAVAAAAALQPLVRREGQDWFAVGAGTAAALAARGVAPVRAPTRMDSEGLLALLPLHALAGRRVGLVTAPGGRGMIAAALEAAGAHLRRADVYARVPVRPSARRLAALQALPEPWLLPISSGEALTALLAQLPDPVRTRLQRAQALAASDRLAVLARTLGFADVRVAVDARPESLLAAAVPASQAVAHVS